MIEFNEWFETREEAEAFCHRVYASYHPMGYGTTLSITEDKELAEPFHVTGYRYSSCD